MNYRHLYHAGNHTEVFKHAVLVELLKHLQAKQKAFCVLDTHAGLGLYNLESEEAQKTGEAIGGIKKVQRSPDPVISDYLALVGSLSDEHKSLYPGSPEIIRRYLRENDRLIACELHPKDVVVLKNNLRGDNRVAVHHRDGYEAVGAFVPFPERRGLVFIDPPFERLDESEAAAKAIAGGLKKWPTGIFAVWYPIKGNEIGDYFCEVAAAQLWPKSIDIRFLPHKQDGVSLAGSGMLICNAPWSLTLAADHICNALLKVLSTGSGRASVTQVTPG